MRSRKKGEIVWVRLAEITGDPDYGQAEAGLRHEGPKIMRQWEKRLQRLHLTELKRIKALRAELDPELAPALFKSPDGKLTILTSEGGEEAEALALELVGQVFAGVRGWPDLEGLDVPAQLDELDRRDIVALLMEPAREAQALKPAQFPPASGVGDVQTSPTARAAVGSRGGGDVGSARRADDEPVRCEVGPPEGVATAGL